MQGINLLSRIFRIKISDVNYFQRDDLFMINVLRVLSGDRLTQRSSVIFLVYWEVPTGYI